MAKTTWLRLMATGVIFGAGVAGELALRAGMADSEQATTVQDKALTERIEKLIAVFGHPDAAGKDLGKSNLACNELKQIGAEAVPQLIEAIVNKEGTPAAYSKNTLEDIGPHAVEIVRAKWPRLDEVQKWKLMRFRGQFDYEESVQFVVASLNSIHPEVRRQAIEYVGQHKESRARRQLLRLLNTEVPEFHRWFVIESLGEIGNDDEAADALIRLLGTENWVTKGQGRTPPPGPTPPWWPDSRECVIWSLGKMGAPKAGPALLELLDEKEPHKGFYFNRDICRLLGDWDFKPAVFKLKELLNFKHEWFSPAHVAGVLLQLKDRSGVPLLIASLKEDFPLGRRLTCKVFADHGDEKDITTLGTCLHDSDADVKMLACQGLERITGVVLRASGQTVRTNEDIRLWIDWLERNNGKLAKGKLANRS